MISTVDPISISYRAEPTGLIYAVVDRAEARLESGDRAGAYFELFNATGNQLYLMQAQTTTYSGANGGLALGVNQAAKENNPDLYQVSLDEFSHNIDATLVANARQWLDGDSDLDPASSEAVLFIDTLVWANNGMQPETLDVDKVPDFDGDNNLSGWFGGNGPRFLRDEIVFS